ncbi:MAG: outer membrane lipoprotein carrier protein LolA [Sphingomonadaceae bacterium]
MIPLRIAAILLCSAASLTLPMAAGSAQMQTSSDATDLARVAAYIRETKSLVADFAQTDRRGQTLNGKLTLKQPGKIRFQYQQGVPLLIVGDGSALTLIDYEVRQVQRWPIKSSPLGALIDPSRDFTKFSKVIQTGDSSLLSIEARDPKRPEFGTITLVFKRLPSAPGGLNLYGWVARDAQGNRTAVRLTGQQYNAAVADSAFRWRDPRPQGPRAGG